jgi:hypothetical protein
LGHFFRLLVAEGREQNLEKQTLFAFFRPQARTKIFLIFFTKPLDKSVRLWYNSLVSKEHTNQPKGE